MTRSRIVVALALAAAPSFSFAGHEALSVAADKAFFSSAFGQPLLKPIALKKAAAAVIAAQPAAGAMDWFNLAVLAPGEQAQGGAALVADVELSSLLNKQLKSPLKYSLGGKDVWISGAFDRQQNAYASILVEGAEARFHNVKGLLDKEEDVAVGTSKYKLYLNPNVINQMKSEIILENAADEEDKVRVTLKKMLEAIGSSGVPVTAAGQAYKVFYTDDVKGFQADKSAKSFTFVLTEPGGHVHVFLIPAELVPSDKVAVFRMFADTRVGLYQKDGKLKIFENL